MTRPALHRQLAPTPPPTRRPLNVVIVIVHLATDGGAVHGPARLLLEQLPRFDPAVITPTLCVLRPYHPIARRFQDRGFEPIFLGRARSDPRALIDLIRLLRRQDADLAHLLGEKAMILGRMAALVVRCRAVIHLRDSKPPGTLIRTCARLLAPSTSLALGCAVSVTRLATTDWSIPPQRTRTLLNGINVDRFTHPPPGARARIRAELGIPAAAPVVAMIGRMVPEKGHATLLRAFPTLSAAVPGCVLLAVGDGPTRPQCETLAHQFGIGASVRFTGQRHDTPELLAAADVVALPSGWGEGLPGVAIEAIAAGRPVVAFPVAGTTDVVVHGQTGIIVPQDDGPAMARALAAILSDAELRERLSRAARRHSERFRIEENVRRLQDIYVEVARGPRAQPHPPITVTGPRAALAASTLTPKQ